MASTFSLEVEMKSDVEKVWEWMYSITISAPRDFPQVFKSIEVLEGDGNNAGTLRLVKYPQESPIVNLLEKLEMVNIEEKMITYSLVGGDILKFYNSFKATVVVSPLKGGGTLMKYNGNFERVNDAIAVPESIEEFLNIGLRAFDKYLVGKKEMKP